MADLYGGMARLGIDPERADRMELWQIGAALGMHRPEPAASPGQQVGPQPMAGVNLVAARMVEHRKTCSGCDLCASP